MRVRKFGGKVYGADFTSAERKAMQIEIKRELAKIDVEYQADIDALVLYVLMSRYGWRKKRLHNFWNAFKAEHNVLRDYYEMNDTGDNEWLAHRKLAGIGVDVRQWYREDEEREVKTDGK